MNLFDWDEKPELNITPLVDVMLVLLAVLMVTAPTLVYEEKINLPDGSKSKSIEKYDTIEIKIDAQKNIAIRNNKFMFNNFADNFSLATQSFSKQSVVVIYADKNLIYDDIIYILKSVKEAGFNNVSLATNG